MSDREPESGLADLQPGPASLLVPDPHRPLLINSGSATRALQERFLANADRGDDAANDELVAELLRRIRAQRTCHAGGC